MPQILNFNYKGIFLSIDTSIIFCRQLNAPGHYQCELGRQSNGRIKVLCQIGGNYSPRLH